MIFVVVPFRSVRLMIKFVKYRVINGQKGKQIRQVTPTNRYGARSCCQNIETGIVKIAITIVIKRRFAMLKRAVKLHLEGSVQG